MSDSLCVYTCAICDEPDGGYDCSHSECGMVYCESCGDMFHRSCWEELLAKQNKELSFTRDDITEEDIEDGTVVCPVCSMQVVPKWIVHDYLVTMHGGYNKVIEGLKEKFKDSDNPLGNFNSLCHEMRTEK